MLPFEPETDEAAFARLPAALAKVWRVHVLTECPPSDRPGLHREHVFDFHNGMRMIASLDQVVGPDALSHDPYVHFSISVHPERYDGEPATFWQSRAVEILKRAAGRRKLLMVTSGHRGMHAAYAALGNEIMTEVSA